MRAERGPGSVSRKKSAHSHQGTLKRWLAGAAAVTTAVSGVLVAGAVPAYAAPVYEITARWAPDTATQVASGDVVNSEWRVNVNDDAAAPSNDPVDNVTFTTTVSNGRIASVPDLCLTTAVTPVSAISADSRTLTCNVGTQIQGTAAVVVVPTVVDGPTGSAVSLAGAINGQPASVPEIPVTNAFGMDIRWEGVNNTVRHGLGYVHVDYQWSLSMAANSDPGPSSVTYTLGYATANNSVTAVAPDGCSPFIGTGAPGHPWSGGVHLPHRLAPFVESCSLTKTSATGYQLKIDGIDYSRLQVPTEDSMGRPLPVDRQVVASGQVTFRVNTTTSTGTTLQSNAPTYTAPSGQTAVDDAVNNRTTKVITFPGSWSSMFHRGGAYMNTGGTQWDDSIRVSPGTTVYQQAAGNTTITDRSTTVSTCTVIDTRFVEYTDRYYPAGWNPLLTGEVFE